MYLQFYARKHRIKTISDIIKISTKQKNSRQEPATVGKKYIFYYMFFNLKLRRAKILVNIN